MTREHLATLQKKITTLRVEGKYKETIETCYALLLNATPLKDYKSILTAYANMVASYYCIGDIETAFGILSSYEEICDEHGDDSDKLNLYNALFLLYEYKKELRKAIETLKKSIALGEKLQKYNMVSNGYSNMSHVYMLEKDYQKALEMANLGLEMAKLHNPPTPILEIRVKLNIAKAYIGLKNFGASKTMIDEMIKDPLLDTFIREKAQCYDLQGDWYKEKNLNEEASHCFTEAKILIESYDDVYLLKDIEEKRANLCELLGDFKSGFEIQKEYIALLRKINEREVDLAALRLEIQHNISKLTKEANTDFLTGIYNRNYLEPTVNMWLNQDSNKKENVTFILFDIDSFKHMNDMYGHLFGDEIIKKVSKTCKEILRNKELFGRFGGDEFIVILKGFSLEIGKKKAEEVLNVVRNLNITNNGVHIKITLSIGIANNLTCNAASFTELFKAADINLYKAKANGKNQICADI